MKNPILVAVLAGAVAGGAASALVGTIVVRAPAAEPAAVAPEGLVGTSLEARLAELEQRNANLLDRIQDLEARPLVAESPREAAAPAPDDGAMLEKLEAIAASIEDPKAAMPEGLRDSVNRALKSIREEEDRARQERQQAMFEERLDDRLAELSVELGLSPHQSSDLRTLFVDANDRREEILEGARDGGDWTAVRDSMRQMRDDTESALARVLTPSQLEAFKEKGVGRGMMGPDWFGPGGDRRGRRDGPGGGGPGQGQ